MDARQELEDLRRLDELEARAAKTPSMAKSGLEGVKQGATLGFGDEISGAMDVALGKTGNLFVPEGGKNPYADQPVSQTYTEGRDQARQEYKDAQTAHPYATMAGSLAGAAPTAILSGPGIGVGAAVGGAYGLGSSDKDTAVGMGIDAAKGAVVGGALSAAPKAYSSIKNNGVGPLASKAGDFALDYMVPGGSKIKNLVKAAMMKNKGAGAEAEQVASHVEAPAQSPIPVRRENMPPNPAPVAPMHKPVQISDEVSGYYKDLNTFPEDGLDSLSKQTDFAAPPSQRPADWFMQVRKNAEDIGNTNGPGVYRK